MSVNKEAFGDHTLYRITNASGAQVSILSLGATVQSIIVPDRDGNMGDVVVGYDTDREYLKDTEFVGATIGRFANRIGGASFALNGQVYKLTANEGRNTLHGGEGFEHREFELLALEENAVVLGLTDPAGNAGFPGELKLGVRFEFTDTNSLVICYMAMSSEDTVINFTNHSYFNLACSGSALGHELRLSASRYLPVDEELIPTGELRSVKDTEFDFTERRPIEKGTYDHCYVLDSSRCAELYEPVSGRKMYVLTDLPGIQLYVGGAMRTRTGKNGVESFKNSAVCLETQFLPDSPNKPRFPSCVLNAGKVFKSCTVYSFSVE